MPMSSGTPMMRQYARLKRAHRGAVLFFRLGDFYEMFQSDAVEVSQLLGLTLTKRNGVPMCGVPHHSARVYIGRLLSAGKKIAICEQVGVGSNGLAEREVVEVLSPGVVMEDDYLQPGRNNYIMAIGRTSGRFCVVYLDVSTGELQANSISTEQPLLALRDELARIQPNEIILQESMFDDYPRLATLLEEYEKLYVNREPDWSFDLAESRRRLLGLLGVVSLKGFGIPDDCVDIFPAAVLLDYIGRNNRRLLVQVRSISLYGRDHFVELNEASQRNLELVANLQDGGRSFTLFDILDNTMTAMGRRRLRRWLLAPLRDPERIIVRQKRVEQFYQDQLLLEKVRTELGHVLDLERLASRVIVERAHAKDLLSIAISLEHALRIGELLSDWFSEKGSIAGGEDEQKIVDLAGLLRSALQDELSTTHGGRSGIIRDGYDPELDRLRTVRRNGTAVLERYLEEERAATGIASLKLRFHRSLGYCFEVSKAQISKTPEHFVLRQSMVNGARFSTERLGALESDINNAAEQIDELEQKLFIELRAETGRHLDILTRLADRISRIDCLQSLATGALRNGWIRPTVDSGNAMNIEQGRHPVVAAHLPPGEFVPNNLCLDQGRRFALITGPNMAGKSTYLRQTALIVIMAQIGAFVPAQRAQIGVVDKIFCRVGASDNLVRGESTFLVEMSEAAYILRSSSVRSLIIMDEIGRGTATRDGLAIAHAICEYILDNISARCLFATHFHELTTYKKSGLFNLSLAVQEKQGDIIFLRHVREGAADRAYGINVARLAGLPGEVIERARCLLTEEIVTADKTIDETIGGQIRKTKDETTNETVERPLPADQSALFGPLEMIERDLRSINVEGLTPLDALNNIARWKSELAPHSGH